MDAFEFSTLGKRAILELFELRKARLEAQAVLPDREWMNVCALVEMLPKLYRTDLYERVRNAAITGASFDKARDWRDIVHICETS